MKKWLLPILITLCFPLALEVNITPSISLIKDHAYVISAIGLSGSGTVNYISGDSTISENGTYKLAPQVIVYDGTTKFVGTATNFTGCLNNIKYVDSTPFGGCGIVKVNNISAENIKAGVKVSYGLEGNTLTEVTGTFTSDANAYSGGILQGLSAYVNGSKVDGSMTNRGNVNVSISPSQTYTIPEGYHAGSGTVGVYVPTDLPSADKVLAGTTIWVHDITWYQGTMPNNGAVSVGLYPGQSYTVPAGYHNGSGSVRANWDGNLTAGNIKSGVSIYGVTGTYNPQPTCTMEELSRIGGTVTGTSAVTSKFYNFVIAFVGGADNSDRNTSSDTGLSGTGTLVYNQNTYNTSPDTTSATRATVWQNVSAGTTISTYGRWTTGSYILGIVCN